MSSSGDSTFARKAQSVIGKTLQKGAGASIAPLCSTTVQSQSFPPPSLQARLAAGFIHLVLVDPRQDSIHL